MGNKRFLNPKNGTKTSDFYNEREHLSTLKIVTCTCGTKILVLPDENAMIRAIKTHESNHKGVEDYLTKEVLKAASK